MSIGGSWDARAAQAEHIGPTDTGDNIEAKRVAGYVWNGSTWERDSGANPNYATRIDDQSPILYIGKAPVGSSESAEVWQISKWDTSTLTQTWAGSANFNQVWDDRGSLTYV